MERIRIGEDELTVRVSGEMSDGSLLAVEVEIPAGGGPPMLHRHASEEVFRLERGELAIYVEDGDDGVRRILARPGDVVHIRGGRAHTVRNESGTSAAAYVVFAPGTEMERFARDAGALAADRAVRPEEVLALAARHGIEITAVYPDRATGSTASMPTSTSSTTRSAPNSVE